MEKLLDIKLKKDNYAKELEKTRLEIKKVDECFDNIRQKKIDHKEESLMVIKRVNFTN